MSTEGGDAESVTSASSSLHRAWIDVKSWFVAGDREGILNEAERGEDAIKKAYSDALRDGARSQVSAQTTPINTAHDRIKALPEASKS